MRLPFRRFSLLIALTGISAFACSDSTSPPPPARPQGPKPVVYELPATQATGPALAVKANQNVKITVTDSVSSNPGMYVPECDHWTDANGIADCDYVISAPECRGLPFMALLGNVEDDYFVVGTDFDSTFTDDVQLNLLINDWVFGDNAGKFTITVLIK